jgi:hypothetical protein
MLGIWGPHTLPGTDNYQGESAWEVEARMGRRSGKTGSMTWWTKRDGTRIKITNMDDAHLVSALRMVYRNLGKTHQGLDAEHKRRKLPDWFENSPNWGGGK